MQWSEGYIPLSKGYIPRYFLGTIALSSVLADPSWVIPFPE